MNETWGGAPICGKIPYASERKARSAVEHLERRGGLRRSRSRKTVAPSRQRLDAYRCEQCRAWHVGNR